VTPTAIRATVRDYIRAHQIFRPGPLVVAVSGGADSTALLLLLSELADEFGLVLHVAHFDHRIRPRASAREAEFVAQLANRVGAPIRVGRATTRLRSEDDARSARYEFLRRAAREIGATAIATGHTRDDQAETVILHLVRGSGVAGLAGMRPLANGVARPLLAITRADTVAVCKAARIRPLTDPSNRSLTFARNRIRRNVMPQLAKLNPRVADAIARLADAAAGLADAERRRATAALTETHTADAIDLAALADDDVRADVLAEAWLRATGKRLASRQRDALTKLTATHDGTRAIDLPGGRAIREYARLRIAAAGDLPARTVDGVVSLAPGVVRWNEWQLALGVSTDNRDEVVSRVPSDLLGKLVVRKREPGDRMTGPHGKKVQDVFTDAKVPALVRDRWPVIAGPDGVWWVPLLTPPPRSEGGTALAVAAPKQMGNVLWPGRVREVASKARRSRGGRGEEPLN
jgi:tRNA(Ile)-lysidine synthase